MTSAVPFDTAWSIIREQVLRQQPPQRSVPINAAQGQVSARDVRARLDIPPFSRAMMDGYALHAADAATAGARLRVTTTALPAGTRASSPLPTGWATRIMTGAPLPPGADAVVRLEWCEPAADGTVTVLRPVPSGESVQHQGADGAVGTLLLSAGRRLRALDPAVLRAYGVTEVTVARPLRIALIPTGNEVQSDARRPLAASHVYDVNTPFLAAMLRADGHEVTPFPVVPDDPALLSDTVRRAASTADVIMITGGVSSGDFDYVPGVVQQLVEARAGHASTLTSAIYLRRVHMRPGSPLVFARLADTLLFGLSGNPAACYIQFEALVRPALRLQAGESDEPFPLTARIQHDLTAPVTIHTRIVRGDAYVTDGTLWVDTSLAQSAGAISSLVQTTCLVRHDTVYAAGDVVPVRLTTLPSRRISTSGC